MARATLACLIATLVIPLALMTPPADATAEPVTSLRVAKVDSTSITLAWSLERNPHQSKVVVRYAAGLKAPARPSDGMKGAVLDPRRSERLQIGGLRTAATYSFSVFVKNDDGTVSKRAVVRGRTGPPPVTDLTALPYRTRVELAWAIPDHPSVAKVVVRYAWGLPPRTLAGGTPVPLDAPLATSATLADLPERTEFGFTVWTRDAKGRLSSPQRISATTIHYPGTVTDLTATPIADHSIELSWVNPTTPHFYGVLVRRCEGNTNNCQDLATLGPESTSFTDTDVTPDAPYQYGLYSIGAENEITPWAKGVSVTAGPTIDDPATPNDHCGHVNTSTTWTSGTHTISCNVIVDPGVTLTIAPGSAIEMTAGDLRTLGSVVTVGTSEAPITWAGVTPRIKIEQGGSLTASYDDFGDTAIVGESASSITIDHVSSRGRISAVADVVSISNSEMVNVGASGPQIILDRNRIDGYAIALHNDPGSLTVTDNEFTGVEPGVLDDSPMVISSTELRHLDFPGNTASGYAYNAIRVYGLLKTSTTLSNPDDGAMPIAVHGLSVEPGVTLTIAPGTLLRAYAIGLQAGASLDVAGTSGSDADPDGQRVTIAGLDDPSVAQPGYFGPDYQVPESPILYGVISSYEAESLTVRSLDLIGYISVAASGTIDVEDLHAVGGVRLHGLADQPNHIRLVDSTVESNLPSADAAGFDSVEVRSDGGNVEVRRVVVHHQPQALASDGISVSNWAGPTASTTVVDNVVRGNGSPRPADATDACPIAQPECMVFRRGIHVAVQTTDGEGLHVPLVSGNTVQDFPGIALAIRAPEVGETRMQSADLATNIGSGNWADSIAVDGVVDGDWAPSGDQLTPAAFRDAQPGNGADGGLRLTAGSALTLPAGRVVRGFALPYGCGYLCWDSSGEPATLTADRIVAQGDAASPVTFTGLGSITGAIDGNWVDFVDSRAVVTTTSTLDHASFSGSVHGADALLEVRNTQDPETSEWSTVDLAITNSVFRPGPNTFAAVVDLNGEVDQQTGELQPRGSVSIAADFEIPTGGGLLRLPDGTVTITGHLVSRAGDSAPQIVTACAHADSRCSGSMAGFDWGSPDGPFQGPGLPLACGAVTVSPWAGQVDPEIDHPVPDCA